VSKKKSVSFDGGPVGFKRPPVEHQFKKGQKPPGSGRKKGTKNCATYVREIMKSRVSGAIDGKPQRMPMIKALVLRWFAQGLVGNPRDIERIINLAIRLDRELDEPTEPTQPTRPGWVGRFTLIDGDDW
jgi:hypothetical protein